jgi:hypothetical protein
MRTANENYSKRILYELLKFNKTDDYRSKLHNYAQNQPIMNSCGFKARFGVERRHRGPQS